MNVWPRVTFTICFVDVFLNPPLFIWTNFADYVISARHNQPLFKSIAQLSMLLFAPLYVVLINSVHEVAPSAKKVSTRLGLSFAWYPPFPAAAWRTSFAGCL